MLQRCYQTRGVALKTSARPTRRQVAAQVARRLPLVALSIHFGKPDGLAARLGFLEVGVPVAAPVPGSAQVRVGVIGGCRAAAAVHEGPYNRVSDTYVKLMAWIQEQGVARWRPLGRVPQGSQRQSGSGHLADRDLLAGPVATASLPGQTGRSSCCAPRRLSASPSAIVALRPEAKDRPDRSHVRTLTGAWTTAPNLVSAIAR